MKCFISCTDCSPQIRQLCGSFIEGKLRGRCRNPELRDTARQYGDGGWSNSRSSAIRKAEREILLLEDEENIDISLSSSINLQRKRTFRRALPLPDVICMHSIRLSFQGYIYSMQPKNNNSMAQEGAFEYS